jgi:hypothetical protein
VRGGSRPLELKLPGGVRCQMLETSLLVEVTPGRLRVRNQVGQEVNVIGPEPAKPFHLFPGEEVGYPVFDLPAPLEQSTMRWGQVAVRYAPGVQLTAQEGVLFVEREAEGQLHAEAPLSVGGVATRPGAGRLVILDPHYAPAPPEALPEAPVETPVATPVAPAEEPTPPAAPPEEPQPSEETQR